MGDSDLRNPAKVRQIVERFTANYDLEGNNPSSSSSGIARIFAAPSASAGFSTDLLLSLQNLKVGGS